MRLVADNITGMWEWVKAISTSFRSLTTDDQTALTDGLKRYVEGAKAAVDLMTTAAGIDTDGPGFRKLRIRELSP